MANKDETEFLWVDMVTFEVFYSKESALRDGSKEKDLLLYARVDE